MFDLVKSLSTAAERHLSRSRGDNEQALLALTSTDANTKKFFEDHPNLAEQALRDGRTIVGATAAQRAI